MTSVHRSVLRAAGPLEMLIAPLSATLVAQAGGTRIVACANNGTMRQMSSQKQPVWRVNASRSK